MTAAAIAGLVSGDMPIHLSNGERKEHHHSWRNLIRLTADDTPHAGEAVALLLSSPNADPPGHGYGQHIVALAAIRDDQQNTALQLAALAPRQAMNAHLLFDGCYELQVGPPEHRSATSVVLRAYDHSTNYATMFKAADQDGNGVLEKNELEDLAKSLGLTIELLLGSEAAGVKEMKETEFVHTCKKQLGDGPRPVVLKLMTDQVQWERERDARKMCELDSRFVVGALVAKEVGQAVDSSQLLKQWKASYLPEAGVELGRHMIVMDAADRNLLQIYQQERPDINAARTLLQQLFEIVNHLHEQQLMHGDIKSLNAVRMRIDGRLRGIDFDASQPLQMYETYAAAKFSSATLPPELIYKISGETERAALARYWEQAGEELQSKVAPLKAGTRQYVVKSFRTEQEGGPIKVDLPYDLVPASDKIDCWALGVLAYMLCAGEPLFLSTRDDDIASGEAMAILYEWGTKPRVVNTRLEKVGNAAARDLIRQLLQRNPEDRLAVAEALEHPFFHTERSNSGGAEILAELNERSKEMNERTKRIEVEQEKQTSMLTTIQELSVENRSELRRTREVGGKSEPESKASEHD
mmetsp:Transcript_74821/g.206395  ORF Transcript_74821/g.206395 Transcript_74821/m.206395 type:complete len:582 (-) Transcript_74821:93-1838(-)